MYIFSLLSSFPCNIRKLRASPKLNYFVHKCNTCPIFLCQVQEAYCERYHERVVALLDSFTFGEATKKFHTAVSHSRASMLYESPVAVGFTNSRHPF